jgi:integrase
VTDLFSSKRDGVSVRGETVWLSFMFDGKRQRVSTGMKHSPQNLMAAQSRLDKIKRDIALGNFSLRDEFPELAERTTTPWTTAVETWLRSRKPFLAETTFITYEKDAEIVSRMFEGANLESITRADIKTELGEMGASRCSGRIRNLKTVIKGVFEWATDAGLVPSNPAAGISLVGLRAKAGRGPADPFTPEEVKAILGAADSVALALGCTYRLAFYTGMRMSELFALQREDVRRDQADGVISVSAAKVRGILKETKTAGSTRKITLLPRASVAIDGLLIYGDALGFKPLLLNPYGNRPWIDDAEYRRVWTKVLALAGVRYRNPYQTRHTYASLMLMAGEPEMWVAAQMGHADWGMIRKVYGKWIPAAAKDAGAKGARFIAGVEP